MKPLDYESPPPVKRRAMGTLLSDVVVGLLQMVAGLFSLVFFSVGPFSSYSLNRCFWNDTGSDDTAATDLISDGYERIRFGKPPPYEPAPDELKATAALYLAGQPVPRPRQWREIRKRPSR